MGDENSLQKYKGNLTSGQPANNFNRPNLDYKNGGRLEYTNYNTIKLFEPEIGWNLYKTKDRITNFGNTSSSLKGSGFVNTMSDIFGIVTAIATPVAAGLSIAAYAKAVKGASDGVDNSFSRKERKEINKNTVDAEDAMYGLDSTITTGQAVLDNVDNMKQDTIMDAAENIRNSITAAQAQKNEAIRKNEEAQRTKGLLEGQKTTLTGEYNNLGKKIQTAKTELSVLEQKDTSKMTPEEKTAHENQIKELKSTIEDKEKEYKKLEEDIAKLDQQIQVQQQIIDTNNQTIRTLDENITRAQQIERELHSHVKQ